MAKKQLWLLEGGNGAGKSTFYHTQLARRGIPFVNTDILAKQLYPLAPEAHSYDAARIAAQLRSQMLLEGRSFCFETVFSHPSKVDFVAHSKALGYEIILIFIHLDNVSLNQARISSGSAKEGIPFPKKKYEAEYPGC